MRVAVLTCTRDRLTYTQECFQKLKERAGCDYDHYVLDQGSQDGTPKWLRDRAHWFKWLELRDTNVGISPGINMLLEKMLVVEQQDGRYDAVVKFDNDCEVLIPGTLDVAADLASRHNMLISPQVRGLRNPPGVVGEFTLDGQRCGHVVQLGGIFLAAPRRLYDTYRYDESNPVWGLDDVGVSAHMNAHGDGCAYLLDIHVNHYETTDGQHERYGAYFDRRVGEGGPP